MEFNTLIIGGSVAGISSALILGSALRKPYAIDKRVGIIAHQRASALQDGIFNNAFGISKASLGVDILMNSLAQLKDTYPEVICIEGEKVSKISKVGDVFKIITNKQFEYYAQNLIIATGNGSMSIEGLEQYIIPHKKSIPEKNRIQLINTDHLVEEGLYVAGTLAGHRSQLSIAAGSGAMVATDILVKWNNGKETHSHDSIKNK